MKKIFFSLLLMFALIGANAQDIYGSWVPVENSDYSLNISKYGTFKASKGISEDSYLFSLKGDILNLKNDRGWELGKMRVVVSGEGDERTLEIYDNTKFAGKYKIKKEADRGGGTNENRLFEKDNGGSGWSLSGRSNLGLPKPPSSIRKDGKIIVKIWVDRSGNVVDAEAPLKGSTIADRVMVEEAKATAMKARFSASETAPEPQAGTITYVYTMQ